MNSRYDARRRNRNIGTSKSGHGQDNCLTIPNRWTEDRVFYEVLTDPTVVVREVNGRKITFLVEPTHRQSCHACTIDDIVAQLRVIPTDAQRGLAIFILRQPTRKQQILNPTWGRLSYWSSLGRYSGTAVVLEAQVPGSTFSWSRSLSLAAQEELVRLREDGHEVAETTRDYKITISLDSIRATQLYRTLPHEIGHNAHYLEEVEDRMRPTLSRSDLEAKYSRKLAAEREAYAHRFADSVNKDLLNRGRVPFDRIESTVGMRRENLDPRWFAL